MAKNKLTYQDLGLGPDTDILPTSEPYLEFISNGEATSVNDLPVVVGVSANTDYLIVYIPGTGHRKILVEDIGEFFPAGGNTGQILVKNSNTSYDVSWINVPVGGVVDEGNTFSMTGDIVANGTFDVNGDLTASSIIALPNVVVMDGGSAFSQFPAEAQGPYGVLGLHPAGGLAGQTLGKLSATDQDIGWVDRAEKIAVGPESGAPDLTADLRYLTFEGPGVQLQQPTPGHIVAYFDNFTSINAGEFCPNYPFVYVSTTVFRVENLDRTGLFSPAQRLHFIDGVNDYYGTIASSVYSGGHTDITMTMESGAVLTNTIDNVCLTRGITDWQLLNVQPLGGIQMNDIAVGTISSVTYWVVVGNGGELAYSTDKLQTWTTVQLPTAYNLECIIFDPVNARFFGGGGNSEIFWSDDGINWFLNQNTNLHAQVYDWSRRITTMQYSTWNGGTYFCTYGASTSQYVDGFTFNYSTDQGVNWNGHPAGLNLSSTDGLGGAASAGATPVVVRNGTQLYWDSAGVGGTVAYTAPGNISWVDYIAPFGGQILFTSNGRAARTTSSSGYSGWVVATTDPWVSSDPINDACFSSLLHPMIVCVGGSGKIAVSTDNGDNYAEVSHGFSVGANITDVVYSEDDLLFCAIADNGEIAVSTNGGV